MNTFQDGEGVVHAVVHGVDPAARIWRWWSLCLVYDDIHRGDVYQIHRRSLTCIACTARYQYDLDR